MLGMVNLMIFLRMPHKNKTKDLPINYGNVESFSSTAQIKLHKSATMTCQPLQ